MAPLVEWGDGGGSGVSAMGALSWQGHCPVARWQWGVVLLWVLYTAFVLLAVVEFLREGTPKGAVVMGTILGFGAIVWAVLLERFLFKRRVHGGSSSVPERGTHG